MRKLKIKYILLIIIIPVLVQGQDLSGISAAFTDPGFGSRPSAMGGAFAALANDVHAVVYNPAGLTTLKRKQALFSFRDQLGLVGYHYFAAAMPLNKRSAVGTGLVVSGDKALREYTLYASYARDFNLISAGANLKLRYASFGNNGINDNDYVIFEPDEIAEGRMNQVKGNAVGFGVDLGLRAQITEELSIGLVYKDLLSPVYWDSHNNNQTNGALGKYSETIPSQLLIGAAYGVLNHTVIVADFYPALYEDLDHRLKAGIESVLFDIVALRGGMQTFFNSLKDEKYSMGIGLKVELSEEMTVNVDYTYQLEELADSQIFSVGLEF
ncbi:MAG: hypothetical protein WC900_09680 [Oscillospiraceae bacterium]|jgi:opacity protein-like surface antigen